MIVRKMRAEEIDITVNLTRYYAQEAAETQPNIEDEYDSDSVVDLVRGRTIEDSFFWFNAYENTRPVGFISGCVTTPQWNNKIYYCHVDLIFLLKEHRNINNFKSLVNAAEDWGLQFDAQKITAGDIGINPERTTKLYESLGFNKAVWMSKDIVK